MSNLNRWLFGITMNLVESFKKSKCTQLYHFLNFPNHLGLSLGFYTLRLSQKINRYSFSMTNFLQIYNMYQVIPNQKRLIFVRMSNSIINNLTSTDQTRLLFCSKCFSRLWLYGSIIFIRKMNIFKACLTCLCWATPAFSKPKFLNN